MYNECNYNGTYDMYADGAHGEVNGRYTGIGDGDADGAYNQLLLQCESCHRA